MKKLTKQKVRVGVRKGEKAIKIVGQMKTCEVCRDGQLRREIKMIAFCFLLPGENTEHKITFC